MHDWSGKWRVEASIPGGGRYEGTLAIESAGEDCRLTWDISDGTYFGVGAARPEGLFASCAPDLDQCRLLVLDLAGREGRLLDRSLRPKAIAARPDGPSAFVLSGAGLSRLKLHPNGSALFAEIAAGDQRLEGLGWRTARSVAAAWGGELDRHVILFYEMAASGREATAKWALGRIPALADERLRRIS
ncbi:MAG: hypothetical protein HXY23_06840 [Parvularculaceae bacterium]|jgi:hypothetical protein|nr:hypothetical protein [Parvularculaceae bacterium]